MAVSQTGDLRQAPTTTDLSTSTGLAVVVNSSGNLVVAGADQLIDGVLVDDPKSGQAGTYQVRGVAKVVAGGTIALSSPNLTTNASGQFVAAASTDVIVARALEAGASGNTIRAEIGYRGLMA